MRSTGRCPPAAATMRPPCSISAPAGVSTPSGRRWCAERLLEPGGARVLVRLGDVHVELEADARPVAQLDVAVLDDVAAVGDGVPVVHAVEPVELEDEEVRHR